jgi:hypothetical protein
MKNGIILGGNSSNSKRIFTLQKKMIRIMAGANQEIRVEAYLRN